MVLVSFWSLASCRTNFEMSSDTCMLMSQGQKTYSESYQVKLVNHFRITSRVECARPKIIFIYDRPFFTDVCATKLHGLYWFKIGSIDLVYLLSNTCSNRRVEKGQNFRKTIIWMFYDRCFTWWVVASMADCAVERDPDLSIKSFRFWILPVTGWELLAKFLSMFVYSFRDLVGSPRHPFKWDPHLFHYIFFLFFEAH